MKKRNILLRIIEVVVWVGWFIALIAPLFAPSAS